MLDVSGPLEVSGSLDVGGVLIPGDDIKDIVDKEEKQVRQTQNVQF